MRNKFRTRAGWIRIAALLLTLVAIATPREAAAQFVPYYGKN